ncbi:uncharacterized protein EI90DRAFT_3052699 [Cantharellus anzutake]|uniref:uncharacterized protein n=1 Tax=Cantharellus anzutake TaxID=1750568 RepID=UPI001907AAEA|nr:uncharacterized protein EI90DRAFT_3052699 [Cantharellus anzutake]KAF8333017.1 hypothetical protein EI90DRAFT_3052699 [Cantharellus anzutake]
MTTYSADVLEHDGITKSLWLTVSLYVCALTDILHDDPDWEILSYTLCYLPLQLSNKHLFCGPRTRKTIGNMLSILCNLILTERVGSRTVLPADLKVPDVYGLAYQTLTILIGYRDAFESHDRGISEQIVQAFTLGLNKHHTLAKPCLQALSICAYELQNSTAKFLPQILEKLVQIMSQPAISRHILELLAILGTIPEIFSNLREIHFTLIFTAAGRYIQRHSRPVQVSMSSTGVAHVGGESFALSQHINILAFYVIYLWFLGIKLPERERYISSISKHLNMVNEGGNEGMMEMVEICFDWLTRYTYSNTTPKPPHTIQLGQAKPGSKSWLVGNSILTIQNLPKPGWVAVTSRRPSGILHLTTRIDNITSEKLEDVDPKSLLLTIGTKNEVVVPGTSEAVNYLTKSENLATDPSFLPLQLSQFPHSGAGPHVLPHFISHDESFVRTLRVLDYTPVVDLHKIGVMYAAPGQTTEEEILSNEHGSPAYTRFLHGLGRLIELKGQKDLYPGGLDTSETLLDGPYAYAWWDDITQIIFHAATMMPNMEHDPKRIMKKSHIGNDWVRIIWNDSGIPYRFDMLSTAFQLVNIIIEPHSAGTVAAFSNSSHENEFFKLTLQRAPGMPEFGPVGEFKLLSAKNLASYVRQVSLLASLFAQVYDWTKRDTVQDEYVTNWRKRLQLIKKLRPSALHPTADIQDRKQNGEAMTFGDFTPYYSRIE